MDDDNDSDCSDANIQIHYGSIIRCGLTLLRYKATAVGVFVNSWLRLDLSTRSYLFELLVDDFQHLFGYRSCRPLVYVNELDIVCFHPLVDKPLRICEFVGNCFDERVLDAR